MPGAPGARRDRASHAGAAARAGVRAPRLPFGWGRKGRRTSARVASEVVTQRRLTLSKMYVTSVRIQWHLLVFDTLHKGVRRCASAGAIWDGGAGRSTGAGSFASEAQPSSQTHPCRGSSGMSTLESVLLQFEKGRAVRFERTARVKNRVTEAKSRSGLATTGCWDESPHKQESHQWLTQPSSAF